MLERYNASLAKPREELGREGLMRARRALLVLIISLAVELTFAAAFWPPPREWQPWVGGVIGVTILLSFVITAIFFRSRAESLGPAR